jgi:hypothetical protein
VSPAGQAIAIGGLSCLFFAPLLSAQIYQASIPADHPAIHYYADNGTSPVARLAADPNPKPESLTALLQKLGISPDSQILAFAKTSFQAAKTSPRNPRAIYFNDQTAVAWVPGATGYEIAAADPRQGAVFFTYNPSTGRTERSHVCLRCHQGPATLGVAGMFIGSVFPNSAGQPYGTDAIITDHRTAFADRWGGWYVTAKRGEQLDRANSVAPDPAEPEELDNRGHQNLTSLVRFFNPAEYLRPFSDIVALMTFEHQTQMLNFFTRLNWESRIGHVEEADLQAAVDYMLFNDEAPLAEPIEGVSPFTTTFPQQGPRDRKGRSLRDFDLKTRLFRYPLSYEIYSPAFDALPAEVREAIYQRLYKVLSGKDQSIKFARLTEADRCAIREILTDTKKDLPPFWK